MRSGTGCATECTAPPAVRSAPRLTVRSADRDGGAAGYRTAAAWAVRGAGFAEAATVVVAVAGALPDIRTGIIFRARGTAGAAAGGGTVARRTAAAAAAHGASSAPGCEDPAPLPERDSRDTARAGCVAASAAHANVPAAPWLCTVGLSERRNAGRPAGRCGTCLRGNATPPLSVAPPGSAAWQVAGVAPPTVALPLDAACEWAVGVSTNGAPCSRDGAPCAQGLTGVVAAAAERGTTASLGVASASAASLALSAMRSAGGRRCPACAAPRGAVAAAAGNGDCADRIPRPGTALGTAGDGAAFEQSGCVALVPCGSAGLALGVGPALARPSGAGVHPPARRVLAAAAAAGVRAARAPPSGRVVPPGAADATATAPPSEQCFPVWPAAGTARPGAAPPPLPAARVTHRDIDAAVGAYSRERSVPAAAAPPPLLAFFFGNCRAFSRRICSLTAASAAVARCAAPTALLAAPRSLSAAVACAALTVAAGETAPRPAPPRVGSPAPGHAARAAAAVGVRAAAATRRGLTPPMAAAARSDGAAVRSDGAAAARPPAARGAIPSPRAAGVGAGPAAAVEAALSCRRCGACCCTAAVCVAADDGVALARGPSTLIGDAEPAVSVHTCEAAAISTPASTPNWPAADPTWGNRLAGAADAAAPLSALRLTERRARWLPGVPPASPTLLVGLPATTPPGKAGRLPMSSLLGGAARLPVSRPQAPSVALSDRNSVASSMACMSATAPASSSDAPPSAATSITSPAESSAAACSVEDESMLMHLPPSQPASNKASGGWCVSPAPCVAAAGAPASSPRMASTGERTGRPRACSW
eukprot:363042-Chlamydomonas_euryale.AAC.7